MSVEHPPGSLTAGGDAREIHLAEPVVPSEIIPSPEIPDVYGENRLIFLVRDPETLFAAWEVTPATLEEARNRPGMGQERSRLTLRINEWQGRQPTPHVVAEFDVDGAHSWYIYHNRAGAICQAQLGMKTGDMFSPILESALVEVPSGRESNLMDVEWATIEEVLERSRQGHFRMSSRVF